MPVGLIADCHIANHRRHGGPIKAGINRRCQHVLDALERAVNLAVQQGCEDLVILGDLFDTTNPPQQIVTEVQRILTVSDERRCRTHILLGNHDMVSTDAGDHALGPLEPVSHVIDQPIAMYAEGCEMLLVPFQPGPAVEWLPQVLKDTCGGEQPKYKPSNSASILLHLGIADDSTPVYLKGSHDAVPNSLLVELCKEYGFKAVFAGNWHSHKILRKRPLICQVGAVCPTGWDNEGLDDVGTMVIWHGGTKIDVHQIPGPRFLKLRAGEQWDQAKAKDCNVYVQITADSKNTAAALDTLDSAKQDGLVVGGEVVPDTAEVREAARRAATVARSADTLDEALHVYIEHMALPDDVTRADVLALAKQYLGGASL